MGGEPRYDDASPLGLMGPACRAALAGAWTRRRFGPGQLILAAEASDTDVGFLISGCARAAIYTPEGRQITFIEMADGDCFGEFAAIDGGVRSATVVATTECLVGTLSSAQFNALLDDNPAMARAFLRLLVRKLRELSLRIEEISTMKVDKRVRLALLRVAKMHRTGPDTAEILSPPTQSEIASLVVTNRETVAKEMGRLRNAGLIQRSGRALIIPSIARFQSTAMQ